jgi:hypothetical protein
MTLSYILSELSQSVNLLVLQGANLEGVSSSKLYTDLASSTYSSLLPCDNTMYWLVHATFEFICFVLSISN